MTTELTVEDALKSIKDATGVEALEGLKGKIETALQLKTTQLAAVQGEVTALKNVVRLIETLTRPLPEGAIQPVDATTPLIGETELEKERKERIQNHRCSFRDRNKKWCQRKLGNKMEKAEGFCSIHLVELGIAERDSSGKVHYKTSKE